MFTLQVTVQRSSTALRMFTPCRDCTYLLGVGLRSAWISFWPPELIHTMGLGSSEREDWVQLRQQEPPFLSR